MNKIWIDNNENMCPGGCMLNTNIINNDVRILCPDQPDSQFV